VQDRETLRRYLLGQTAEAELSQVEERLMSDSDLYEGLLILEDEIIDQYVRGALSEAESASFERYFLQSPEHRQKLRFARALSKYVDRAVSEVSDIKADPSTPVVAPMPAVAPTPAAAEAANAGRVNVPPKPRRFSFWALPALSYALVCLVMVAIGGVTWIALHRGSPTAPGEVFEATLVPGGVTREGGAIQTITIPAGTDTLRLRLTLPAEQYESYRIELIAGDGNSVLTLDQLSATEISGKKALNIDIPAHNLRRDSYRIKLGARSTDGYEDIATYNFLIR
jgi:hypothetical protein